MQDFYKQLLFLVLGITMGAALLGSEQVPTSIVLIVGVLLIVLITVRAILAELKGRYYQQEMVEKALSTLLAAVLLVAIPVLIWLSYAIYLYRLTVVKGYNAILMSFMAGIVLIILILVSSVIYGAIQRYLNHKN